MSDLSTGAHQFVFSVTADLQNEINTTKQTAASIVLSAIATKITQGVSAHQISRAWEELDITIEDGDDLDVDLRTLAARDIGAGAGNDATGQAILFEEIVMFLVHKTGGAGRLEINPQRPDAPVQWLAAGEASDALNGAMRDGDVRVIYQPGEDGLATPASANMVRFSAVGGPATFNLHIFGRHDIDESSSSSLSSSSSSSSSMSSSSVSSSSSSSFSSSSQSSQSSSLSSSSSSSSSTSSSSP